MEPLKECPFCGSHAIFAINRSTPTDEIKFVGCHAKGCCASNKIEKWNTRHSPWISIKERLPNLKEEVILIDNEKNIHTGYLVLIDKNDLYWNPSKCSEDCYLCGIDNVTHWQSMPQPPKETE